MDQPEIAHNVAGSLADSDPGVRDQALAALRNSPVPPPMSTIERAFASLWGDEARGLIELMREREDSSLPERVSPAFKDRSAQERLQILTTIAGHSDVAAVNLITLGLKDSDPIVQRAALLRLLALPADTALSLIEANEEAFSSSAVEIAAAVRKELVSPDLFPFLRHGQGAAAERLFPSANGTGPVVSPDGKWVAYVETGCCRPGGTGGMGRSNLLSITHVVGRDGSLDRVVSDMFLVGWMADSRGVASSRDGFAAVTALDGRVATEFGLVPETADSSPRHKTENWQSGSIRAQRGDRMPHTKSLRSSADLRSAASFDWGEDAAFSLDRRWFGPQQVDNKWQFLSANGEKVEMEPPDRSFRNRRFVWSPDGAYVLGIPLDTYNSYETNPIRPGKAWVIDFAARAFVPSIEVDLVPKMGEWIYRQGRWNPWSKDGKRLAFIRDGQGGHLIRTAKTLRSLRLIRRTRSFLSFRRMGARSPILCGSSICVCITRVWAPPISGSLVARRVWRAW